jgi:hypothetical protein
MLHPFFKLKKKKQKKKNITFFIVKKIFLNYIYSNIIKKKYKFILLLGAKQNTFFLKDYSKLLYRLQMKKVLNAQEDFEFA